MIVLESKDNAIWELDKRVLDIISVAINKQNTNIEISTNHEGICLRSSNFYDILDSISNQFKIDKKRFIIFTPNVEEFHDDYTIKIVNNNWITTCKSRSVSTAAKDFDDIKTVGCFVGRPNWARLSLVHWIDKHYSSNSMLSCHYNRESEIMNINLEFTEFIQNFPDELVDASKFLYSCPRLVDESIPYDTLKTEKIYLTDEYTKRPIDDLSIKYSDFFIDLVSETYYTGLTFFPTEKTFRPIIMLTPFITFGPVGFLSNLQRCGFKTFNEYWDESYDTLSGKDRIIAIRKLLDQLMTKSNIELKTMYEDMQPILQHNKQRLNTLTANDLKFPSQK